MNNIGIPHASTIAEDVDAAFMFITIVSAIIFFGTTGVAMYFTWAYRQRNNKDKFTQPLDHNTKLEIAWSVIPFGLLCIIFVWGFNSYLNARIVPPGAMEIKVSGQKWFWSFDYPGGVNSVNELVIPKSQPIKALISSKDVIHSFYIPAFRVKMDALPNRYTVMSFTPTQTGEFDIFCAEYCGTSHSEMIGKVKVVSRMEYEKWLEESVSGGDVSPEEFGAKLSVSKACVTCHSIDGSAGVGPTWKGIFETTRNLEDGSSVVVDENYLRSSILEPSIQVVSGYQPVMPSYQGVLSESQLDAMIAYIKSLK